MRMLRIPNLNYNGGTMKKMICLFMLLACTSRLKAETKIEPYGLSDCISDPSQSIPVKYMRSVLAGGLIGAGTGILSAYFDSLAPQFWPITWFIAMNTRCDLLSSIGHDMTAHDVAYHDGLMRLGSLVSTWIAWYKSYSHLNGRSPF